MKINIGYFCESPIFIEFPENLTSEELAIRLDLLRELKTLTLTLEIEND